MIEVEQYAGEGWIIVERKGGRFVPVKQKRADNGKGWRYSSIDSQYHGLTLKGVAFMGQSYNRRRDAIRAIKRREGK